MILEHEIYCLCEDCNEFTTGVPNRNGTGYELDKRSEHIGHKVNFSKTIPSYILKQQHLSKLEMQIISKKYFGKENKIFANWNKKANPNEKKLFK